MPTRSSSIANEKRVRDQLLHSSARDSDARGIQRLAAIASGARPLQLGLGARDEVLRVRRGGCLGAGVLNESQSGAPSDQEQRQYGAGNNDERQLHTSAGENPQRQAADDSPEPHCYPRFQSERVPPRPANDRANEAPGEEWPGRLRYAKEIGCLLVAAASDDRKDQDADHVHSNRRKDPHNNHTTLRP
jgi:hypothetical protein